MGLRRANYPTSSVTPRGFPGVSAKASTPSTAARGRGSAVPSPVFLGSRSLGGVGIRGTAGAVDPREGPEFLDIAVGDRDGDRLQIRSAPDRDRAAAARTTGGRGRRSGDAPDGSLDQQRERTASLGDLDGATGVRPAAGYASEGTWGRLVTFVIGFCLARFGAGAIAAGLPHSIPAETVRAFAAPTRTARAAKSATVAVRTGRSHGSVGRAE